MLHIGHDAVNSISLSNAIHVNIGCKLEFFLRFFLISSGNSLHYKFFHCMEIRQPANCTDRMQRHDTRTSRLQNRKYVWQSSNYNEKHAYLWPERGSNKKTTVELVRNSVRICIKRTALQAYGKRLYILYVQSMSFCFGKRS